MVYGFGFPSYRLLATGYRLLRFFACASSFMTSLALELNFRTFEPMNLVFSFWNDRLLQTANDKLYPLRRFIFCAPHQHYALRTTHYALLTMYCFSWLLATSYWPLIPFHLIKSHEQVLREFFFCRMASINFYEIVGIPGFQ